MLPGYKHRRVRQQKIAASPVSVKQTLLFWLAILLVILCLHVVLIQHFERLSWEDALWLTFTTATTVGYGDLSAETTYGRMTTIGLIFCVGIAVLAQCAALFFEYRQEIRFNKITGNWRWKMKDHIVFLHCPHEGADLFFYQALRQLRGSGSELADTPVVLVADQFARGLPPRLSERNMVLVNKPEYEEGALDDAAVATARLIVIFSVDSMDPASDGINFELIYRLRQRGVKARIIVEAVQDESRERLIAVGANHVIRPIRSYPELLVRAMIAPGTEQLIETMFNSAGEECLRIEVACRGTWKQVIIALMDADLGVPLGYENTDGILQKSPRPSDHIDATAVFVLLPERNISRRAEVASRLSRLAGAPAETRAGNLQAS